MHYQLSNGKSVELKSNLQAARFVYLAMPFQGLFFKWGQEKPHIIMTPDVLKIIALSERFRDHRVRAAIAFDKKFSDEDIPF